METPHLLNTRLVLVQQLLAECFEVLCHLGLLFRSEFGGHFRRFVVGQSAVLGPHVTSLWRRASDTASKGSHAFNLSECCES